LLLHFYVDDEVDMILLGLCGWLLRGRFCLCRTPKSKESKTFARCWSAACVEPTWR